MLWHGALNFKNTVLTLSKYNSHKNKYLYVYNNKTQKRIKTNSYVFSYLLPSRWNVIIIHSLKKKQSYIYMYSHSYFFKIPLITLPLNFIFDKSTRQLLTVTPYVNNYNQLYKSILDSFYNTFMKPVFLKLKFKGKGYYIYKNYRNTITPQFGYSHRLYLYTFFLYVTFLSKTSLLIFGLNLKNISYSSKKLYNWRPLNIFTGRGVRFSKQIVYKKSGKVSSYR